MHLFDCVVKGDAAPFEVKVADDLMDQYYPAHKAQTEPRFTEISRGISADEFCGALELARATGLAGSTPAGPADAG